MTIIENDHLSINGVRAKGINYFREKSFDFFVQLVNDAVGGIGDIYLPKTRVGKDRCHLLILHKTPHGIAENVGGVAASSIARTTRIGEEILWMVIDYKTKNLVVATNNRGEYFSLVQHRKLNIKQLDAIRSGDNKVVITAVFIENRGAVSSVKLLRLGAVRNHSNKNVCERSKPEQV